MKITLALALLLSACAPGPTGVRPYATSPLVVEPHGPSTYTPTQNIVGGAGPISRRCKPQPSGIGADCQSF